MRILMGGGVKCERRVIRETQLTRYIAAEGGKLARPAEAETFWRSSPPLFNLLPPLEEGHVFAFSSSSSSSTAPSPLLLLISVSSSSPIESSSSASWIEERIDFGGLWEIPCSDWESEWGRRRGGVGAAAGRGLKGFRGDGFGVPISSLGEPAFGEQRSPPPAPFLPSSFFCSIYPFLRFLLGVHARIRNFG